MKNKKNMCQTKIKPAYISIACSIIQYNKANGPYLHVIEPLFIYGYHGFIVGLLNNVVAGCKISFCYLGLKHTLDHVPKIY